VKRWNGGAADPATNPATYLYYDGWSLIEEGANPAAPTMVYYHGAKIDEILASYNTATDMMAYHYYDANGNCTLLTDWQGNIKEQYYYDAFGYPYFYNGSGTWLGYSPHGNRFLFTGREYLSDLKLYDYRHRMYHPELGRFMQPDPKQFTAGDYNLYRYCHNDPINKTDPTGLIWAFTDKTGKFDPQLKKEFEKVRAALSEKSSVLKGIFDRVANDTAHTVTVVRSNLIGRNPEQFKGFASGNASFEWNPRAASSFADGKQSPATVLLHEAAHADGYLSNKQGTTNAFHSGDGPRGRPGSFHDMEERRVILGPEAIAAHALQEDARTPNSGAAVTYSVSSLFGR
jgi:RHS repeat-associated protein